MTVDSVSGLISLNSTAGSIGAMTVTAGALALNAPLGSITLTDKSTSPVTLTAVDGQTQITTAAGKAFALTLSGGLLAKNDIIAGSSIKVTTKSTTAPVEFDGNLSVTSSSGALTVTATGRQLSPKATSALKKTLTLTSSKGSVDLDSIGAVLVPNAVKVSALNNITNSGQLSFVSSLSLKATSATSAIDINGNIEGIRALTNVGTLTITDSGSGGINAAAGTDISAVNSVKLSATKGAITVGSVGNNLPTGSVSITALNTITNNGPVAATRSITEKANQHNQRQHPGQRQHCRHRYKLDSQPERSR